MPHSSRSRWARCSIRRLGGAWARVCPMSCMASPGRRRTVNPTPRVESGYGRGMASTSVPSGRRLSRSAADAQSVAAEESSPAPGPARSARRGEPAAERDGGDAKAVDEAAASLFAIFEAAREQGHTRLSSSQLQALLAVERDEGLNLGALADTMGVILSSASRLCDRLVAAGMLERGVSAVDRREVSLTLTRSGREVLANLRADRRERLDRVLRRMAPAARAALLRGLREFGRVSGKGSLDLTA